jgi:hypothetical protein
MPPLRQHRPWDLPILRRNGLYHGDQRHPRPPRSVPLHGLLRIKDLQMLHLRRFRAHPVARNRTDTRSILAQS